MGPGDGQGVLPYTDCAVWGGPKTCMRDGRDGLRGRWQRTQRLKQGVSSSPATEWA